jgi:mercuric ion binding protein
MKNLVMVLILAVVGFGAQSQEKKSKNAQYVVDVNGNCGQCKKRIEKAAYSVPGVKSAVWDIDDHELRLILNEEKTSLAEVKKAVAKAGHDTEEVKATDTDYQNLHSCCKYERK